MIKKGDFLISTPESLGDYYFNRSIVILAEVNENEIVGFIVNKELDYTLNDLDNSILDKEIKIFSGGPVNQDNLYFIHAHPELINNGINFYNKLFWGGEFKECVKMINERKVINPSIKFFSGYSGWTHDQLIEEIKNGSWIIKKNETNNMFCNDSKKMWRENMKKMDGKFKIWSNAPEDPQNN